MAEIKYYDPGTPLECARTDCKAQFFRRQDTAPALSTQDAAQLHGWKVIDREGELLLCPMHAEKTG